MIRLRISVMKKVGKSGIMHWRQIVLLMRQDTETFVLKTFYGRKLDKMTKQEEIAYEELAFAERDFQSLTEQRCDAGYELLEYLCSPMNTKSLAFFQPPRFNMPKGEALHNMFMNDKPMVATPVLSGMRVYVKIGSETVCSVRAIDAFGNDTILPKHITEQLMQCVKLGKMESAILEGYVDSHTLTITDVPAVNSVGSHQDLEYRLSVAKQFFGKCKSINVCRPVKADALMLNEHNENRNMDVRFYIVKDPKRGFEQADAFVSKSFILPNFYSMEMTILERPKYGQKDYKVGLIGNNQYHEMGTVESGKALGLSDTVTVNFTCMSEGKIHNAWICEDASYRSNAFKECSIDQLHRGSDCWAARLTNIVA